MKRPAVRLAASWLPAAALGLVLGLTACSSAPERPAPTPLAQLTPQFSVRQAWRLDIGPTEASVQAWSRGDRLAVANAQGLLLVIDAATGQERWRLPLGTPVTAGVGGDGERFALVTRAQELVVAENGKVLWRQRLGALSTTAPLVAGGRVFVLTADRSVSAFDAQDGRRLWSQGRNTDPLVLRRPGLLMAMGDTLLAGLSGRLVALNPDTGQLRWEVPVGTSRGTNEIERLVDVVAGVHRDGPVVCARAFQAAVSCIDTRRGQVLWTRSAQGHEGLSGDAQNVYGVESDGRLRAWARSSGEPVWQYEGLRFRGVGSPALSGRSLVVGDAQGVLHWFSADKGEPQSRVVPDGSALLMPPVQAGNTLVAITANGAVVGYRPQ